jgi:hypothetical protein
VHRTVVRDEELVVVASHLRPEEAGMLRGLLESDGITAVVRDDLSWRGPPGCSPAPVPARLSRSPKSSGPLVFLMVNSRARQHRARAGGDGLRCWRSER